MTNTQTVSLLWCCEIPMALLGGQKIGNRILTHTELFLPALVPVVFSFEDLQFFSESGILIGPHPFSSTRSIWHVDATKNSSSCQTLFYKSLGKGEMERAV